MFPPTFFATSVVLVNSLTEAVCAESFVKRGLRCWNGGQPFGIEFDAGDISHNSPRMLPFCPIQSC